MHTLSRLMVLMAIGVIVLLALILGCEPCFGQLPLPAQVPYDDQSGPLRPAIAPIDAEPTVEELAFARASQLNPPARSYSPNVSRGLRRVVAQIDAHRVTDWKTLREAMTREMDAAIPDVHRIAWRQVFAHLAPRTRVQEFRQARDRIEELAVGFGKVCTRGQCTR